jgi:hypothetical protein
MNPADRLIIARQRFLREKRALEIALSHGASNSVVQRKEHDKQAALAGYDRALVLFDAEYEVLP